jgi:hypothetical protein
MVEDGGGMKRNSVEVLYGQSALVSKSTLHDKEKGSYCDHEKN